MKILLKTALFIGFVFLLSLLPEDSFFVQILLIGVLIFLLGLLVIVLLALGEILPGLRGRPYAKIRYGGIEVSHRFGLNGGGLLFAYQFLRTVGQRIGKVDHVFEYCAGPGFIGFSLLANDLCNRLTLADINLEAVAAVKETIKNNRLENKVAVYQSDCLDNIPKSEQWDLVVGNPPWHLCSKSKGDIKVCDFNGRVHEQFYRDIKKFLKPGGSILFIESTEYTRPERFKAMARKNGLTFESFRPGPWSFKKPLMTFVGLALWFREVYFIQSSQ